MLARSQYVANLVSFSIVSALAILFATWHG
jgi:hypothetical protein